jgi:hypothetical protein
MSTRSIIAVPYGDTWRGRYCHCDGYPTGNGRTLWALVKREGLDVTRKVLTEEHYGWSSVDENRIDISGIPAFEGKYGDPGYPEFGTPEHEATIFVTVYGDGRFENVPGWGVAYTDTVIERLSEPGEPYQQITDDEWLTPEDTRDTEWFYVLTDAGMIVGQCNWDDPVTYLGEFRWDGKEPNWAKLEGIEEEKDAPVSQ